MNWVERHLARVARRHPLSPEEIAAIRSLPGEIRTVPARTTVIREGVKLSQSTLLLDGLMCRAKTLGNGKRHITELHVAGDFVDLHSFTLKRLDHDIETLAPCTIALVPHAVLETTFATLPRLARIYWFHNNLDAANHRETVLSLGQRSAVERVGAMFCELRVRLDIVGLVHNDAYALALTQADLGDHLGLTPVHINRVLRQLRDQKLVTFRNSRVEIHDLAALQALAGFHDRYLYLNPEPL